ncbi:hypothetical protein PVT71_27020 (plasmid) [Salipiger sp. H15]|uniref:Hedgehog/Intein (Hint) domain-containing protein n=1 Tax=Alloyangia sp. H15 TaxID=3029062 RepID=A0AAU8AR44_9RHOB
MTIRHIGPAGIPLEADAPLAQVKVMDAPVLAEIAEVWLLHEPGTVALPRTTRVLRLAGNLAGA